jgi:hypothetical protein
MLNTVFEMLEQGLEPMSLQKFIEQAMAEVTNELVVNHYHKIQQNQ